MPARQIIEGLREGSTLSAAIAALDGTTIGGRPISVRPHPHALPYLDHLLAGVVRGPPTSTVEAVLSGRQPGADLWRRFTLSHRGPWSFELEVFPTPFHNHAAPLAPGIPPGASRPEAEPRLSPATAGR